MSFATSDHSRITTTNLKYQYLFLHSVPFTVVSDQPRHYSVPYISCDQPRIASNLKCHIASIQRHVCHQSNQSFVPSVHQQPTRRVGSIEDYDPVNEQYGSISQHNANPAGGGYRQETTYQVTHSAYTPFTVSWQINPSYTFSTEYANYYFPFLLNWNCRQLLMRKLNYCYWMLECCG